MTDQTEPLPEPQWGPPETDAPLDMGWEQAHPLARRPQSLDADSHMANHLITISFTPKGQPMIVVRGNDPDGVRELLAGLSDSGVYMHLAAAQQDLLGSVPPAETIMRQLGGQVIGQQQHQPPMASGYPPVQQAPQWGPPGPPVPSAGPPPFGAPAGGYAPPQPQWGGGMNQPPARPAGWYAVKIPFNQKEAGDAVKNSLKAQGLYQGNVRWEGETKTWLVSPTVAGAFQQWGPVPA